MSELFLTKADLIAAGALDWDAALDDIHDALALLKRGEAEMAAENVLPLGPDPRDKGYGLPARSGRHLEYLADMNQLGSEAVEQGVSKYKS